MNTLSIAQEYTRTPGPRYPVEGEFSGQIFRLTLLAPMMEKAKCLREPLVLDLDGTAGYGVAFLDEAVAGLVRYGNWTATQLRTLLIIKSDEEPYLIKEIWEAVSDAEVAVPLPSKS